MSPRSDNDAERQIDEVRRDTDGEREVADDGGPDAVDGIQDEEELDEEEQDEEDEEDEGVF